MHALQTADMYSSSSFTCAFLLLGSVRFIVLKSLPGEGRKKFLCILSSSSFFSMHGMLEIRVQSLHVRIYIG